MKKLTLSLLALSLILFSSCEKEIFEDELAPVAGIEVDRSTCVVPPCVVSFSNTSENAVSFNWDFGDGNTSNEESPQHIYSSAGTFTAQLTATGANGSVNTTTTIIKVENILDGRDGQRYKTVRIGDQDWMAENLNFNTGGSKCADGDKCNLVGRLYSNPMSSNLCPQGWHIPSKEEWLELFESQGGVFEAGAKLKADNNLWKNPGAHADNSSGFSALPAGRSTFNGLTSSFSGFGDFAVFWSSTTAANSPVIFSYKLEDREKMVTEDTTLPGLGTHYSCRCIKD